MVYHIVIKGNDVFQYERDIDADSFDLAVEKVRDIDVGLAGITIEKTRVFSIVEVRE